MKTILISSFATIILFPCSADSNRNPNDDTSHLRSQRHHGSRVLWPDQEGGEEYWKAILSFLNELKQATIGRYKSFKYYI